MVMFHQSGSASSSWKGRETHGGGDAAAAVPIAVGRAARNEEAAENFHKGFPHGGVIHLAAGIYKEQPH